MEISLLEVKNYLRVDSKDDDVLITSLIESAKNLCMDIIRTDSLEENETIRVAIYYAIAYLDEHREEANHKELTLTLRSILFGLRKAMF